MESKRIEWIDVAKGIGILLVMFGHVPIPETLARFIYSFHIPLFFFLSGLLFSISKYPNFKTLLTKKLHSLVIPYLGLSLILAIWFFVIGFVGQQDEFSLGTRLLGIILSMRNTYGTGTLWFVSCLFVTEILFYIILKMSKGSLMMIFASLVTCSLLGISIVHFYKKPVVWNVDAALIVIAFFGLGYITKNFYGLLSKITFPYILPIYLTASLVIGMNNKSIDIFSNSFGNFFMFYLAALSGIGITLTISKLINKNVILQFAGKNTLLLLPLHTMIYNVLEKFIPFPENMDPLKSILLGFVFVAVALSISVFIINLINKQFPFLAGKTAPNNTKTTVSQSL